MERSEKGENGTRDEKEGKGDTTQRWGGGLTLGAGGPWSSRYVDSPAETRKYECEDL